MKTKVNLFAALLFTLLCTASSLASDRTYEKSVAAKALPENPTYLVVNLYATADDIAPIASQTFYPGEWQLTGGAGTKTINVSSLDMSTLVGYDEVWAETEIDGLVVGSLEVIQAVAPGISVGGTIESRGAGFKFPDATVQTTAGSTPAALASHAANAAAHHSPTVTTSEILNGTILGADVNPTTAMTVGALTINGNGGGLKVYSQNDIFIRDDINGFRWYNTAGDTQQANIVVSSSSVQLYDDNQNRYMVLSNSNGIGIGTASPTSTHAVTIPSLNVTGNLEIGYARVSASYTVANFNGTSCYEHNDLSCYWGSGSVQCPVGTKVLGGGSDGTSFADWGGVSRSYPANDTSWSCASRYLSSATDNCYAICARLE